MRTNLVLYLFYAIALAVSLGFESLNRYQPTNDEKSISSVPPIHEIRLKNADDPLYREILFVTPAGDIFSSERTAPTTYSASGQKLADFRSFAFVGGTPNGTAIIVSFDGKIREVTATGETRWETQIPSPCAGAAVSSSGDLYISGGTTLYAFSPDRRKLWQWDYPPEPHNYPEVVLQYVSVDSDGTVYVETNYGKVFALDSSGKLSWQIKVGSQWDLLSGPVPDARGHIYFSGRTAISAFSRDGAFLWQYQIPVDPSYSTATQPVPVISSDGSIYIARKSLFSLTPDGKERWRFHPDTPSESFVMAPTLGGYGTVYVCSWGKQHGRMYALNSAGKKEWSYEFQESEYANRPARFGPDGLLWKASRDGFLVFSVR
jgi:hypothetical protein